jgi:hypothetical protein
MIISYLECPEHGKQGLLRLLLPDPPSKTGRWRADLDDGHCAEGYGDVCDLLCSSCQAELEFWLMN